MMNNLEDEEKWLKHYASFHEILLVGDGDFSFSLCLAKQFGSASNIVATSLDKYDAVTSKYKNAMSNIHVLKMLGAQVLHGVDATKMNLYTDLRMRKFDRIVFNFPHAGFYGKEDNLLLIKMHRHLVRGFFQSASKMLRPDGQVHVNHKTSLPYRQWNLEELAIKNSLVLIECVDFKIADYPGYNNKRGHRSRCDEPFHLGKASTYKFIFSSDKRLDETNPLTSISPYSQHQLICLEQNFALRPSDVASWNHRLPIHNSMVPTFERPIYDEAHYVHEGSRYGNEKFMAEHPSIQPQPLCFNPNFASRPIADPSTNHRLPIHIRIKNDCFRTFDWYFHHAATTFETPICDEAHYVREGLRRGHEKFMAEHPRRPTTDYIVILEELHHLSITRSAWLRSMLQPVGQY